MNLEFSQPLLLGDTEFGSIRIGVSTLLIRGDLDDSLRPAAVTALIALGVAVFGAMVLAQLLLRPIHVIRSGLTRLGKGEFGVRLDLNQQDEFGELGTFFNAVSAQISADRTQMAGQVANLESAVQHLEDAVAIVSPNGYAAVRQPGVAHAAAGGGAGGGARRPGGDRPPAAPAVGTDAGQPPVSRSAGGDLSGPGSDSGERLILTHPVNDANGELVGIMLTVRNLEYLSQMQSTVRYSRKLAALGRLSAGVAHEVKNPLNSMMIHLELLRQNFAAPTPVGRVAGRTAAVATADVRDQRRRSAGARRRDCQRNPPARSGGAGLPQVQPPGRSQAPAASVGGTVRRGRADCEAGSRSRRRAARYRMRQRAGCERRSGDAAAGIPQPGAERLSGDAARRRRCVSAPKRRAAGACRSSISDTGVGINPEHLQRVFDLYFTTKASGSGIGLSMVYRTVQMHDGDIEVQSTPGKGTSFRILLPQA